jgi:serine/threonine protein kinase
MTDVTEKLERLAGLLEKGLITREQFEKERDALFAADRSPTPRSSSPNVGDSVGAYRILGELGRGGMGVVYRGKHRTAAIAKRQGGEVAIKVLHAQYAQDEVFRDRFEREASMGLKLDHPGIIRVYDLVIDGGNLALVMDLAEGRPLSEVIGQETGPIPWERAWPMFKQMLDAVAYAHEHKVVHRDIKPENVIVSPSGQLKVLDFGIAKDMEGGKTKTGTGMGTVDYMAPEQYTDAKSVDQRADIYALGMTLYEMLAGRLPWESSTTEFQVMTVKSKGDFPPPTAFYPHIPHSVVEAVQKAVEVEKADRFAGVEAMAMALEEANVANVASAPPPSVAQPPPPPPQQPVAQPPPPPQPQPPPPAIEEPPVPSAKGRRRWVWGLALVGAVGFGLSVFLKTDTSFLKTDTSDSSGIFESVSAGSGHTCAVNVATTVFDNIECWGNNEIGQSAPPQGRFLSVSAGEAHTCAVMSGGNVKCWGYDGDGQSTPPSGFFKSVSAGDSHTCGVTNSGSLECWGNNEFGQSTPPSGSFKSVSAGEFHNCGVRSDDRVVCWGEDTGSTFETFKSVSAGGWHTCGVNSSGSVKCWGEDLVVTDVPLGTFKSVSAGSGHTCAVNLSGSVVCWGDDDYGQSSPPKGSFKSVSAGQWHTCGVKSSGSLECWGDDEDGKSSPPRIRTHLSHPAAF